MTSQMKTQWAIAGFLFFFGCTTPPEDVPPPTEPDPPTNVSATAGPGEITIAWSASDGADSYTVYWGEESGVTLEAGTPVAIPDGTEFVHTGLPTQESYFYIVTASNDIGESEPSKEVSAIVDPTPLAAPSNISATAGDAMVTIEWNPVARAQKYHLYWATHPGVAKTDHPTPGAVLPYQHINLTNGTTYFYAVAAEDAWGNIWSLSEEVSAQPQEEPQPPPAPTGVIATAADQEVMITWAPVTSANSYTLYWGMTSPVTKTDTAINGATPGEVVTGLTNGTIYYFAVSAVNVAGESALSSQVSARPDVPPDPPTPPQNLVATPGDTRVTLTWGSVQGATSYNAYYSTVSGAGLSGTKATNISSGKVIEGLENGRPHFFAVTAVNIAGESDLSNEVTATPRAPVVRPPAPENVTLVSGDRRLTVYWNLAPGAVSYNLYWTDIQGLGKAGTRVTGVTPGYRINDLTNDDTYYVVVAGVNAAGEGPASTEASAVPAVTTEPPDQPTNVQVVAADQQVTLTWDPIANADSFNIYFNTSSPAEGTGTTQVTGAVSGIPVTGLTNDTSYYFVVTGVNVHGESVPSAEVSATPVAPSVAPAAPAPVSVVADDQTAIVTWPPVPGATSYTVYWSTTSGVGSGSVDYASANPGVEITGLVNEIPHYFVVVASNAAGNSPDSAEAEATPTLSPHFILSVDGYESVRYDEIPDAGAPGGYDPIAAGAHDLTAGWGPAPQSATRVDLAESFFGSWNQRLAIDFYGAAMGTYTIATEDLRAHYQTMTKSYESDAGAASIGTVVITRYDAEGGGIAGTFDLTLCQVGGCETTMSLIGSFRIRRDPDVGTITRPKAVSPYDLMASQVTTTGYYLLTPVTDAVEYVLGLSSLAGDVDLHVYDDDATFTTSTCDPGVIDSGPEYCYPVAAGDRVFFAVTGAGAFHIYGAEYLTLPVPVNFRALPDDGSVTLRWNEVPGATSYDIYWDITSGFDIGTANHVPGAASPHLHDPATNGEDYYYVITATLPESGQGPVSAEIMATPGPLEPPAVFLDRPSMVITNAHATGCGAVGALSRRFNINQQSTVLEVEVTVNITHPYTNDLDLFLGYDNGEETVCVELSTGNGGSGNNYTNTVFDDEAGTSIIDGSAPFTGAFAPEGALAQLSGMPMAATWTLYVSDSYSGADVGTLNSWSLSISYPGDPPGPPAVGPTLAALPGDSEVILTWSAVEGAGFYNLYWGTDPGVTSDTGEEITAVTSPYHHRGLQNDVPYYYVVTAFNAGGKGPDSDEVGATPVEAGMEVFSDTANLPIPDYSGNAGTCGAAGAVSRTIQVTREKYIHDVDVLIDITHTWDGDLDIWLEFDNHGESICIELSTNNGGSGDDFADTIFDDDAPTSITAGVAPFAGSYRPEKPLISLFNVAMDGNWTLWLSDDGSGDQGTLNRWELIIEYGAPSPPPPVQGLVAVAADGQIVLSWQPTLSATSYNLYFQEGAPGVTTTTGTPLVDVTSPYLHSGLTNGTTYYYIVTAVSEFGESEPSAEKSAAPFPLFVQSLSPNEPIPDAGGYADTCGEGTPVVSTMTVTNTGTIVDVDVELNITHTFDGDLDIFIEFNSVCVALSLDNGGGGENYTNTVFDDEATVDIGTGSAPFTGSFRPDSPLSAFDGMSMTGDWTLYVSDDAGSDTGTLNSWGLRIGF